MVEREGPEEEFYVNYITDKDQVLAGFTQIK